MNRRQAAMAGIGALLLKLFGRSPKPSKMTAMVAQARADMARAEAQRAKRKMAKRPSHDDFPVETTEHTWMGKEIFRLEWGTLSVEDNTECNIRLFGYDKPTVSEWWTVEFLPGLQLSMPTPPTPGQMRNQELLLGWKWRKVVRKT